MTEMTGGVRPLAQSDGGCLNDWICGEYLTTRSQELADAVLQHLQLTSISLALGLVLAFPMALLSRRWRRVATPVMGVTTILYTVPSLAMFSLLLPVFGLNAAVVIVGLALYSLTILVRNLLAGLESVPDEVREAARGLGYGTARLLFTVELPLALPTVMAGLRIAAVSTVSMATIGAIIGYGGLGNLIYDGMNTVFKAEVLTASVLCVLLAVGADLLLLGVQWLLTPWTHRRRGRAGRSGTGRGNGARNTAAGESSAEETTSSAKTGAA